MMRISSSEEAVVGVFWPKETYELWKEKKLEAHQLIPMPSMTNDEEEELGIMLDPVPGEVLPKECRVIKDSKEDVIEHKKVVGDGSQMTSAHMKNKTTELTARMGALARKRGKAVEIAKRSCAEQKAVLGAKDKAATSKKKAAPSGRWSAKTLKANPSAESSHSSFDFLGRHGQNINSDSDEPAKPHYFPNW